MPKGKENTYLSSVITQLVKGNEIPSAYRPLKKKDKKVPYDQLTTRAEFDRFIESPDAESLALGGLGILGAFDPKEENWLAEFERKKKLICIIRGNFITLEPINQITDKGWTPMLGAVYEDETFSVGRQDENDSQVRMRLFFLDKIMLDMLEKAAF